MKKLLPAMLAMPRCFGGDPRTILLLCVLLTSACNLFAQRPLVVGLNENKIDVVAGAGTFYVPAMIYLPSDYFSKPTKRFPLIWSFHGTGEAGTDTIKVLNNGIMYNINNGELPTATVGGVDYEAIVIAPQHSSYSPQESWFKGMFEDATTRFRVDTSMMYFYGMSAGGKPGIGIISNLTNADTNYHRFITAIYLRSPAGNDVTWSGVRKIADRNIPYISLSGNAGGTELAYYNTSWRVVDSLNNYYALADTIVLAGVGHDNFWQSVQKADRYAGMGGKNIYEWFFQYKNPYASTYASSGSLNAIAPRDTTLYMPKNDFYMSSSSTGEITSLQWTKLSGPYEVKYSGSLSNNGNVNLTNLAVGTYVYELSVGDGATTDKDTFTLTIAPYQPPTCPGGLPVVFELNSYTNAGAREIAYADMKASFPAMQAGDTIKIGPQALGFTKIELRNLEGCPDKPIVIVPGGTMADTVHFERFYFYDARYVKLTGGSTYRFQGKSDGATGSIQFRDRSRNLWIEYMQMDSTENGIYITSTFDTTNEARSYYPNWEYGRVEIAYNKITNTGGEGMYINNSGSPSYPPRLPPAIGPLYIHHNTLKNTGWDGIQYSFTHQHRAYVYDNNIDSAGKDQIGGQQLGIISGGYTSADIYNNQIRYTSGNGIGIFGQGTNSIKNNYLVGNGWEGTNSHIYIQANQTSGAAAPDSMNITVKDNVIWHTTVQTGINIQSSRMRSAIITGNAFCHTSRTLVQLISSGALTTTNTGNTTTSGACPVWIKLGLEIRQQKLRQGTQRVKLGSQKVQ